LIWLFNIVKFMYNLWSSSSSCTVVPASVILCLLGPKCLLRTFFVKPYCYCIAFLCLKTTACFLSYK
jgi:hypothetical protein